MLPQEWMILRVLVSARRGPNNNGILECKVMQSTTIVVINPACGSVKATDIRQTVLPPAISASMATQLQFFMIWQKAISCWKSFTKITRAWSKSAWCVDTRLPLIKTFLSVDVDPIMEGTKRLKCCHADGLDLRYDKNKSSLGQIFSWRVASNSSQLCCAVSGWSSSYNTSPFAPICSLRFVQVGSYFMPWLTPKSGNEDGGSHTCVQPFLFLWHKVASSEPCSENPNSRAYMQRLSVWPPSISETKLLLPHPQRGLVYHSHCTKH